MPSQRKKLPPIHPGEILLEDLRDVEVSLNQLARDLRVPVTRMSEIVNLRRAITADTALRLARYFGTSERFWLNLQTHYDLEVERERLGDRLRREVRTLARPDRASTPPG